MVSSASSSQAAISDSESTSGPTGAIESSPVVSGTLRLWMQHPASMNPLVSTQYQWKEISNLFYESLYEIDAKQEAVPELAFDSEISESGLIYTIHLKENIIFHDNSILDSADVIATVQFIQNPANSSIYLNRLSNISSMTAIDANTIQFNLAQPDPFFLYELTFPVLTSENVQNPSIINQPGTGPFQVISYESGVQLQAALFVSHRDSGNYPIKSILVLELKDTTAAMQAFGDDRVDIVLLYGSSYETYYLRNDVKIVRYPSSQFLFFAMNQGADKTLADSVKADHIKFILQDPLLLDGIKSIFCTSNNLPFLTTSPLVHAGQCQDVIPIVSEGNPFPEAGRKLQIIYPAGDMVKEKLMIQLKKLLDREKIPYNVTECDAVVFAERIAAGDYDIALRESSLSSNPDPSWLYLNTSLRTVNGMETIIKTGNSQFISAQTILSIEYSSGALKPTADQFCSNINRLYRYGPFVGIGFRICGVIQSKRIQGQLEPYSFNQYNNLEEVWVWSGQ